VALVSDMFNATVVAALGLPHRLEINLAVPVTLRQTGAGVEGVTSQQGSPVTRTVLRDPRIGAGFELVEPQPIAHFAMKLRLTLSLPLGDERALAGERFFVVSPGAAFSVEHGPMFASSELALRLRRSASLGGTRVGSQALAALGAGFSLLGDELLAVCAETWLLPTLSSQEHALPDGARASGVLAPAEWLLSVRSRPFREHPLSVQLGGGTGLPLSTERRAEADGGVETEHFAGVTSSRFRFVLALRYTAEAKRTRARSTR
jgi:hypothetical protein